MWKLNHKKGFVLIEVLCSLILMSLLINGVLIVLTNSVKVHEYNIRKQKYVSFLDALSKEIEWNLSYDDVIGIRDERRFYMDKSHMDAELLKYSSVEKLFSNDVPIEQPYIGISITGDDILDININLYYKASGNQKNMSISCYKGRYR